MPRIDSHQHFWQFEAERDAWITPAMATIQRDFLPADLQPLLQQHGLDGCVAVQACQHEAETDWLLRLAGTHNFIRGVVGWVDLRADNIYERLGYYSQFEKLKGFRHLLQGETDRQLMLRPEFRRGMAALYQHGFTYDLLILPDQLGYAAELAGKFARQPFVLDHLAKPLIKTRALEPWQRDLRTLAAHENVCCKVSGLVTEANWQQWQPADFRPYLDTVFEAFGPTRVLFGSDWPVCNVAGGYDRMHALVADYVAQLTPSEQARFWGDTATAFYQL